MHAFVCAAIAGGVLLTQASFGADFTVHSVGAPAGTNVTSIAQAQSLLSTPNPSDRWDVTASDPVVNFKVHTTDNYTYYEHFNSTSTPPYADLNFPGVPNASYDYFDTAKNNFVTEAVGFITISAANAGNYTFCVTSDDGFKLTVGTGAQPDQATWDNSRTSADSMPVYNLAAGTYKIDLIYMQEGGYSHEELSAAKGSFTTFNSNFRLVGDSANGGIPLVAAPEPSSLALLAIASTGLLIRRRRAV